VSDATPLFARADFRLLVVGSLLLLVVFGIALYREASPEWSDAQAEVRAIVHKRLGAEKAAELPEGLQQIWIEPLDRVDRCTTCHITVEWGKELADAPHPARSHPPGLLAAHPVQTFGCTLCHGGQGWATSKDAAHGNVAFWEEPLLDEAHAKRYGLKRRDLMELRCAYCHQGIDPVEGMPLLNAAKEKVFDCLDCHRVPGLDSEKPSAPDLSREGEKHPSKYVFPANFEGEHTALRWHIEHFMNPKAMSPGSRMPKFDLTRREAAGLSLLVMSWRRQGLPATWTPKKGE
jgi:hypothetical protein